MSIYSVPPSPQCRHSRALPSCCCSGCCFIVVPAESCRVGAPAGRYLPSPLDPPLPSTPPQPPATPFFRPPHVLPRSVYRQKMPTDSRRLCDCDACTGDCEDPPCLVSKRTWFRHQANKQRRLTGESVSGGGSAGPTGSNTDTDGDEPLADLAPGSGGGEGGRLRSRTVHQDLITRLMGGPLLAARIAPSMPIKMRIRMVMTARAVR